MLRDFITGLPSKYFQVLGANVLRFSFAFTFMLMTVLIESGNREHGNIPPWKNSLAVALSFLLSGLFQPTIGRLIDSGYFKHVAASAAAFCSIGIVGLLSVELKSFPLILVAMSLFLTGNAALQTGSTIALEGFVPAKYRNQAGILNALGVNAGLLITGYLALRFLGDSKKFLLSLELLAICILAIVIARQNFGLKRNASEGRGYASAILSSWKIMLACLFLYTSMTAHLFVTPLIFVRNGLDFEKFSSMSIMVSSCTFLLVSPPIILGYVKLSFPTRLFVACALVGISHCLFARVESQIDNVVANFVYTVGEVFAFGILTEVVFGEFSKLGVGFAAGIKSLLFRSGFFLAPALGTVLHFLPILLYSGLFLILCCIAWFSLRKYRPNTG